MLQTETAAVLAASSQLLFVPTTDAEYERLVALLDQLTDIVRADETHPLARIMDVLGVLIAGYEDAHVAAPAGDPIGVLRFFMAENNLRQADLPELGSQGVVSEILSGKRRLNLRQVRALSDRFNVAPAAFL